MNWTYGIEGWLRSSSQLFIVAARLANLPLLLPSTFDGTTSCGGDEGWIDWQGAGLGCDESESVLS